jgi:ubiquinone/menaquinone biosynthesis C-methylase UbiE
MPMLNKLKKIFLRKKIKETGSQQAYDRWAEDYDKQPDNLMLALDEKMIGDMLKSISLDSKIIADIGCGTGRHWKTIMSMKPARLVGFDVSEGMLQMLKAKYPEAETVLLKSNHLKLPDHSCDFILSTLTIAHIKNIHEAMSEWNRVLKPGGGILISDFHPEALAMGSMRTFKKGEELIVIKNYVHDIGQIKAIAGQLHWETVRFSERRVDDAMKPFYEKQHAMHVYANFYGVPVIYGIYLIKNDVIATG